MVNLYATSAYKTVEVRANTKTNQPLLDFIEEIGHNQASLANLLGVKRPTVNGWCRRGKKPSTKLFLHMCALLKQDPHALNRRLGFELDIVDTKTAIRVQELASTVDGLQSLVNTLQTTVAELQAPV